MSPHAYLVFTGTGPILVLSTYPRITDERLVSKLRYKGIDKFIAHEVDLTAVKARYPHGTEVVGPSQGAPLNGPSYVAYIPDKP